MNMLDSELVVASLRKEGYELTASVREADTILFNTCSVRQHAEDKIYSALGRLKNAQAASIPDKVIGVLGCMAQKDQGLIFERAPYVDLVVGPGQLHQVPELMREVAAGGRPANGGQPGPQGWHPRARSSGATKASIRCAIRRCGRRRSRRTCGS